MCKPIVTACNKFTGAINDKVLIAGKNVILVVDGNET